MPTTSLDLLRSLAILPSLEERQLFAFQHPRLLASDSEQTLTDLLAPLPVLEQQQLKPFILELAALRIAIKTGKQRYPSGEGPLEQIFARERQGEISAEYALALARDPDAAAELVAIA